jgi:hypothetical protein
MERVVDLDQAALEVARRRRDWHLGGLTAGPVTWRDEAAAWPRTLETDRSRVVDPDSVGVHIHGAGEAELEIILFRGGWADVGFIATVDDAGMIPAGDVTSAGAFGELLDHCVARVFGPIGDGSL